MLKKLNEIKIKNTAHLLKRIKTEKDRKKLSAEMSINYKKIMELTKLTDLSRIKWIGPIFARLFFESSTDTALKVSNTGAGPLCKKLVEINNEKSYTKGKFIESDVKLCIKVSKIVPKSIEY